MAYLGFQKRGGPNVCWTLVLTQRGPNQVFQFFYYVKKIFYGQRGALAQSPPKYACVEFVDTCILIILILMLYKPVIEIFFNNAPIS